MAVFRSPMVSTTSAALPVAVFRVPAVLLNSALSFPVAVFRHPAPVVLKKRARKLPAADFEVAFGVARKGRKLQWPCFPRQSCCVKRAVVPTAVLLMPVVLNNNAARAKRRIVVCGVEKAATPRRWRC